MRRAMVIALTLTAAVFGVGQALAKPKPKPKPMPASSVTISETPNPVVYGSRITLSGQATGKNSGAAKVTLYAELAPSYTAPKALAATTTSATGQYSFTTAPTQNAIYFVKVHTSPQATSSQVKVQVKVRVSLSLTGGAGHMFFKGSVLPNYSGKFVVIQGRATHGWKTVARARLTSATSVTTALGTTTRSKYRKRLRLRTGTYRVFFNPADGLRIANQSPSRKI